MNDFNENNQNNVNFTNQGVDNGAFNGENNANANFSGGYNTGFDQNGNPIGNMPKPIKENVLLGLVGAVVLSLLGGVLYYVIYQMGYIAGICGLVTVLLANFGYQKLSHAGFSVKGVVFSVIIAFIVLFIAEYCALANEIYKELGTYYGYDTFWEALDATPRFLKNSEVMAAFIKELMIAYALGIVASFASVKQKVTGKGK